MPDHFFKVTWIGDIDHNESWLSGGQVRQRTDDIHSPNVSIRWQVMSDLARCRWLRHIDDP